MIDETVKTRRTIKIVTPFEGECELSSAAKELRSSKGNKVKIDEIAAEINILSLSDTKTSPFLLHRVYHIS
ncbi:MAG: hypothetical protein II729_08750 [Ruminococcus sp.]|nr:hypothetical protein [Ruminococcus sp.]